MKDSTRTFKVGNTTIRTITEWSPDEYPDISYLEQDCFNDVPDKCQCGDGWMQCGARESHAWCDTCDPTPGPLCHWCHGNGGSEHARPPRNMGYAHIAAYDRGEWYMLKCTVTVDISVGAFSISMSQAVSGIQSDSDDNYFTEVASDQRTEAFSWVRKAIEQGTTTPVVGNTRNLGDGTFIDLVTS